VGVESILGLRVENGSELVLAPCIPDEWPGYEIEFRPDQNRATLYRIIVSNPNGCSAAVVKVALNGESVLPSNGNARIPLVFDGGQHTVEITLGAV
jgi:cyclic beta-1,2-glucan synthetase